MVLVVHNPVLVDPNPGLHRHKLEPKRRRLLDHQGDGVDQPLALVGDQEPGRRASGRARRCASVLGGAGSSLDV